MSLTTAVSIHPSTVKNNFLSFKEFEDSFKNFGEIFKRIFTRSTRSSLSTPLLEGRVQVSTGGKAYVTGGFSITLPERIALPRSPTSDERVRLPLSPTDREVTLLPPSQEEIEGARSRVQQFLLTLPSIQDVLREIVKIDLKHPEATVQFLKDLNRTERVVVINGRQHPDGNTRVPEKALKLFRNLAGVKKWHKPTQGQLELMHILQEMSSQTPMNFIVSCIKENFSNDIHMMKFDYNTTLSKINDRFFFLCIRFTCKFSTSIDALVADITEEMANPEGSRKAAVLPAQVNFKIELQRDGHVKVSGVFETAPSSPSQGASSEAESLPAEASL